MPNLYNSKVVLADGTVLIDLTGDTVDESHVLKDVTFHDKSGATKRGSCTYDSDTSADTASQAEILATKTAHARGAKLTGSMPNKGAVKGTISTRDEKYSVPQGYHDGSGTVEISSVERAKIIPSNIRKNVVILGQTGTLEEGSDCIAQAKEATPKFTQQVILPDEGYTHLTQCTVKAIAVTYSDNSAGGKTVTIGSV